MEPIAIIGIGCRFPKANTPKDFWQLLSNGVDAITEVSPDRWNLNTLPKEINTSWGGFLEHVDQFDSGFFGISPIEARQMDPQQRLLLEVTWEALEQAGIKADSLAGSQTGLFLGITNIDYHRLIYKNLSSITRYSCTGTSLSIAANRLSYLLNLRGPSLAIDTTCSSSLVALHYGIQSLLNRESQMCLVAGVNLILSPELTITFAQAGMMAGDGRCKTFDSKADGYVRGEGCGVLVLKRLSDALADGDRIQAIIKGSAVNQDGLSNGLTAPNGPSQQAVIRQALAKAGVKPAQISYVETHGTGTSLGDPIEVNSLKNVLMEGRESHQTCWIGSVKTNIGHLEAAAGMASLIKVVLSLQHQKIPPHLHLKQLNPAIKIPNTTIQIPTELQSWETLEDKRLAGVSSFGLGGTNVHVILEEAPNLVASTPEIERPLHIFTLSAQTENALLNLVNNYQEHLETHSELSLADICFTANTGRSQFEHRLAVVVESKKLLREKLSYFATQKAISGLISGRIAHKKRSRIAFLFTGQGSQYLDMGRELYETQPTFRSALDQCAEILSPFLARPLLEVIYFNSDPQLLNETVYTQPVLFALEYALFQLWKSWGIEPNVVMGHSVGEYVAACVAGVFSLEDGLKLIATRGRLMQQLPVGGVMVSLMASVERVKDAIADNSEVTIAAVNGPESTVISGAKQAVQSVVTKLEAQGVKSLQLQVSHGFHSPLMKPMLAEFEQVARQVNYSQPRIDLISNVTGQIATAEVVTPEYWCHHILSPVNFVMGMETLQQKKCQVFLECGPKPILLGLGQQCLPETSGMWLPSLRPGKNAWQQMLTSLAELYVKGVKMDLVGFDQDYQRNRVDLPTYPFERQRYWIETEKQEEVKSMNVKQLNQKQLKTELNSNSKINHKENIQVKLQNLIAGLLQAETSQIDLHQPFVQMGADSIVLVEAIKSIEDTFGIKIAIRQLFEDFSTIDDLADYISKLVPSETVVEKEQQPEPSVVFPAASLNHVPTEEPITLPQSTLEGIIKQQLEVMSAQLQILGHQSLPTTTSSNHLEPVSSSILSSDQLNGNGKLTQKKQSQDKINPSNQSKLTQLQQQYLENFINHYTKRTQKSKQQTQNEQAFLADRRASANFRRDTKEMCYPIIGEKSLGSRIWDVDGNEYVDLAMGFGVNLLGHNVPLITSALQQQFQTGIQIGPRSQLGGEVAKLICELTGVERANFCNSGTEAVMTALRIARTATGRNQIVMFAGSYHGHFDGTLARYGGEMRSLPLVPGVTQNAIEDVLVLNYDDPKSLEIIEAHGDKLAAVLVEPVQSRRPDLQPKAFLQKLRKLTAEKGIALIFDEVLLGFRIHSGGAQAWFDIQADLVTYGKIVGGGMPIGVIAGKAAYLDTIDGGTWNFGDDSSPQAEITFSGGTFSKHPLTMAAAKAVLQHLKQEGAILQQRLNQRTAELAQNLNNYFQQNDVPIQITYFGSLFRFVYRGNYSIFSQPLEMELFYFHLLEKGVYIWEGRNCFISTAHTEDDLNYILEAVKNSIDDLKKIGFFDNNTDKLSLNSDSFKQLNVIADRETRRQGDKEKNTSSAVVQPEKAQINNGFWNRKNYKSYLVPVKAKEVISNQNINRKIDFSLYYFGSYQSEFQPDKYNLIFQGAKFADAHNFKALWLPERHFHAFGGFSPNPSVVAAALARETNQIQLRAGSVVLPLHHPIRVAEEWSVVDNLSQGRVGLSFASGWHANDFVFAPEAYGNHREIMFQEIETVKKLWRGERIQVCDGAGSEIEVKLFPMPMQSELETWITVVNNPETYVRAGSIGAGILTNLMGQTVEDLAQNIALYRESLIKHGFEPDSGKVTVLLHTFVGDDFQVVKEKARQPFYNYLRSTIGLFKNLVKSQGLKVDFDKLNEDDVDYILAQAYDRYVQNSALIGTPDSCLPILARLSAIGVDEIACFVDFGVQSEAVVAGFDCLNQLKERHQKPLDQMKVSRSNLLDLSQDEIEEDSSLPQNGCVLPLPNHRVDRLKHNLVSVALMPAQKQLYLLSQISEQANSAYNESAMLKLRGSLNLTALKKAFEKVVERHEALRTIISADGEFQHILPEVKLELPMVDFASLESSAAVHWLTQKSQESFDLLQGPLFRIHLLQLDSQTHLLWFIAHHIIVDGWSISCLLQEVSLLYAAECEGVAIDLEPTKQFQDYLKWQQQRSQSSELDTHKTYWLKQFSQTIPTLELPCDHPRPAVKTYNGARASLNLDRDLTSNLKRFSSEQGCTLFMTLLALYLTLLHRLTSQNEIVVGVPIAQRQLKGAEKIVGYCADLIPIRSQLDNNPTFSNYLTKIRGVVLDAYEHQDYSFTQLVQELNLPRDLSRSFLVNASFNLDRPRAIPEMFGLEVELVSPPVSYTKFDLHLNAIELPERLLLEVDYNTDLFDTKTINQWLERFQTWLLNIVANPEVKLTNLPAIEKIERERVLVEWNNTSADFPETKCIHQLFEAQVEQTPDAIAVTFENEQLTYSELNRRANQVANYLHKLGVEPNTLVGLCVERSSEMIVGMLGILKVGGAYVPIDPNYPQERQAFMLQDAQVSVLLSQQDLLSKLPQHQARVVCLDTDWQSIAEESEVNLVTNFTSSNLAYVIYTSGSTGQPKGVLIDHQGLCNLATEQIRVFDVEANSRALQFASFSFDASVWEIFMALCSGATLCLGSSEELLPGANLIKFLQRQKITHITLPPSALAVMPKAELPELKVIVVAGEACDSNLIAQWSANRRFFNAYGPT
ncbi:MAG: MupA/Atu3671 family FMN-dependent luciferase-like monooxygenase, partial [Waterburya sp.]